MQHAACVPFRCILLGQLRPMVGLAHSRQVLITSIKIIIDACYTCFWPHYGGSARQVAAASVRICNACCAIPAAAVAEQLPKQVRDWRQAQPAGHSIANSIGASRKTALHAAFCMLHAALACHVGHVSRRLISSQCAKHLHIIGPISWPTDRTDSRQSTAAGL